MSQITWQTPAGNLGIIPEGIYYEQALYATVPPNVIPANCTATSSTNNAIICDTTQDVIAGQNVRFSGTPFGVLEENKAYVVYAVLGPTSFQIKDAPDATAPLTMVNATGIMTATFSDCIFYKLQAGTTPAGIQVDTTGVCYGVPQPVAKVTGVPLEVAEDVTSKFTVRAYTLSNLGVITNIADRTFSLTISGNDPPLFVTPAGNIGSYYDADRVNLQIQYTSTDPGEIPLVRLVGGSLPLGLKLSPTGLIYGYIRPYPDLNEPPGYDLQGYQESPYDFLSNAISKNYQFTLEVTDGKSNDLRTFSIYVYNREELTGDDTILTVDNAFVTTDETTVRAPFLVNYEPTDLGVVRSENNFAYRFIGEDYDGDLVEYAISVNEGFGLPPGLQLDPYSGWYYGTIPDVGVTENNYSFNVQVRARSLVIASTTTGTNVITCDTTVRGDFFLGAQVTFEGAVIGGLAEDTTYYVSNIISDTEFTVSYTLAGPDVALTTDTAPGLLLCVPEFIPKSQLYPFTITIIGNVDREVTWLTDPDLGVIENGSISLLRVEAVNRGGVPLFYQLRPGAFNQLPQGLTLLPSGEIAGRASFNTFSIDLGTTTIDLSESTRTGIEPTTFDSTFIFTVNAYATDNQQPLYEVNAVKVTNGGSGFTSAPTLTFNEPTGSSAIQATANVAVDGSAITSVTVTNSGADYTGVATYSLTGPGAGAVLQVLMQQTGYRRIISVYRTFTVRVVRAYNKPYQNLFVLAMPPQNDRALIRSLLTNTDIFVPDYIFRPDDPNFGLSTQVKYQHAFGLAPESLDTYVESLNLNHYWKNLVLGEIRTAQALDADGNVVYEVVYSMIVDDLVNNQGVSVSKEVDVPYTFYLPDDPITAINNVYPNSLVNMRDQVIDTVGQISTQLPLWMTSKQTNGTVLGFTPAWVLCYTKPGRSRQIAYYLNEYFGEQLNRVDFKVDRYELDTTLSVNWDTATQQWTPAANQTTFDRINTLGYTDLGTVSACTELAFDQINYRSINEINALGGLDGTTWISVPGQTPPVGTKIIISDGAKIVFVKQENFLSYESTDAAFTNNVSPFGGRFDDAPGDYLPGSLDYGRVITGGYAKVCTATSAATDYITAESTINMQVNDKIWFTGTVFGGVDDKTTTGETQVYYVQDVYKITGSSTSSATDRITVDDATVISVGDEIWFPGPQLTNIVAVSALDNKVTLNSSTDDLLVNMTVILSADIGGLLGGTTYYIKTIENSSQITLSLTNGGVQINPGTATGSVSTAIGSPIGGLDPLYVTGLARPYYVKNIVGSQIELSDTPGGSTVGLTTDSGNFYICINAFAVSEQQNSATPLALSTDTGIMTVNYENRRMAIWTVTIDEEDVFHLELSQETVADDYVTSTQGQRYANGTQLYHPQTAQQGLTRVNWQPLITAVAVVTEETTFDENSVQWVEPVDMYDPTDRNDKYLVFPKANILQ